MAGVLVDEDAYLDALMAFAAQGLPDHGLGASLAPLPFATAVAVGSDAGNTDDGGESTVSASPSRSQSDQELARQEKARVKYRRIYHMRQVRPSVARSMCQNQRVLTFRGIVKFTTAGEEADTPRARGGARGRVSGSLMPSKPPRSRPPTSSVVAA